MLNRKKSRRLSAPATGSKGAGEKGRGRRRESKGDMALRTSGVVPKP
jgi:hypothetical protein